MNRNVIKNLLLQCERIVKLWSFTFRTCLHKGSKWKVQRLQFWSSHIRSNNGKASGWFDLIISINLICIIFLQCAIRRCIGSTACVACRASCKEGGFSGKDRIGMLAHQSIFSFDHATSLSEAINLEIPIHKAFGHDHSNRACWSRKSDLSFTSVLHILKYTILFVCTPWYVWRQCSFLFEIISMWDVEKLEGEKGKKWMLTFCWLYQHYYIRSPRFCEKIYTGLYYIFSLIYLMC